MMINETKLQIPDEYKEKIQVIYKDKDGSSVKEIIHQVIIRVLGEPYKIKFLPE